MKPADLPTHAELVERYPDKHKHGTRVRYMAGCRCTPCGAANSRYEQLRSTLRRDGLGNRLVPADKARRRLRALARRGIGTRTVCEVAGVARSVLQKIRTGERKQIRHDTQRAILGVRYDAHAGGSIVNARETWQRIAWLLDHGWTKTAIARALGLARPALQLGRDRITKQNEQRIEALYRAAREDR